MKGKKDGIIWSIILIIFSAIIFFVLQFHLYTSSLKNVMESVLPFSISEWRDFFMVIMSGIFTSSFVTLIMNCSDYKNEKINALENYYILSSEILQNFRNLDYLYIEEDLDLIRNYYLERSSNNMRMHRRGKDKNLNYKAKLALEEWIWKNESRETRKLFRKVKQKYLSERVERIISEYDQQLRVMAEQYVKLSEISYQEVENAYGKIDFLVTNKLNRKGFIYKFIHNRQRELLHKIEFESHHLKACDNNDISIVVLDKVLLLQNIIFELEDVEYGKEVYNQYCYEITCNLEFLLQLIYKNKYKENYPSRKSYLKLGVVDIRE